jgi:hypothetical protein
MEGSVQELPCGAHIQLPGCDCLACFLVVGGVSEDEILKKQSKGRANSMHDRQIELWLLYMESKCVRIICWQGDTGTTSSGLTYECMAKVGVLLGGTVPPDISYSGHNSPGARFRTTADALFLGRLN